MSEAAERICVIIACVLIIIATIFSIPSEGADKISALFSKYNPAQAEEIAELVRVTANDYSVNPNIIAAIIVHESGVRPNVVSKGGDYGLMQIRWRVHRRAYSEIRTSAAALFDPKTNIRIGTDIFIRYYTKKKTLRGALLRYSGGNNAHTRKVLNTFGALEK